MEEKYVVIHRCVMNDYHVGNKEYNIIIFNAVEPAVEYIIKCMQDLRQLDEESGLDKFEHLEVLRKYLAKGGVLWEWEWERRGNHDVFMIINSNNATSVKFYDDALKRNNSKTIEQILGLPDI